MLSVCFPILKRYDLARKLLESLRDSTLPVDVVYIMNNGMDRAKAEELVGIVAQTIVLNPDRPLGVAESWNWFIQNTEDDRIITNDDIEFAPMSLEKMVACPECFVSCTFGFSCFLIRDECVRQVGLFDENISPGYGYFEDVDYLRRMKAAKIQDAVVQAGVVHHQSQTPAAYTRAEYQDHNRRFLLARNNYAEKWGDTNRDAWWWGDVPADTKTVTFIVPTIGRESLTKTLQSIELWPGDEIIVVGKTDCKDPRVRYVECEPGGDWGHTERNLAMPLARCDYIAHIDDDDVYAPGTRGLMHDAITKTPGRPVIFRMRFPNGLTLWRERVLRCGELGTPTILTPNDPSKLGTWAPYVGGDFAFLESSGWKPEEYVWRPEVIALLGHNI